MAKFIYTIVLKELGCLIETCPKVLYWNISVIVRRMSFGIGDIEIRDLVMPSPSCRPSIFFLLTMQTLPFTAAPAIAGQQTYWNRLIQSKLPFFIPKIWEKTIPKNFLDSKTGITTQTKNVLNSQIMLTAMTKVKKCFVYT